MAHSPKSTVGRFFEDFKLRQEIVHAVPRTLGEADATLYGALTGMRFPVTASLEAAAAAGHEAMPLDELLAFNVVYGKSVPDVSMNAVANVGYADLRFLKPIYVGTTLGARSRVIGMKTNTDGKTGIVAVETTAVGADGAPVLSFKRWVLMRRHPEGIWQGAPALPDLACVVPPDELVVPDWLNPGAVTAEVSGSPHLLEDYQEGERIDHRDGVTIEEAEHMLAARLYQNPSRTHLDQHAARGSRFGRRVAFGGHVISLARSLSCNGLANALQVLAVNVAKHVAPTFGGDTLYAWSQVLGKAALKGRRDCGALRLRTVVVKNHAAHDFPDQGANGKPHPSVVLDMDWWALMAKRSG